jgi:hypothetical protein
MIERIALDALALRARLPELTLRVGSTVVARVDTRQADHGVIVLAGVPLVAKLPPEVDAGQTLHLVVSDVTPEEVTLRLDHQAMAAHAPPPAPPPPPRLTVAEAPRRTPGDDDGATVALAFESAVLGRLDLRIDLARATVSARVTTPPGATVELAEAAAERLRSALAEQTGRAAQVTVAARRDPFDAYA